MQPASNQPPTGPTASQAWRGTDSLAGTAEARRWLAGEFPEGAAGLDRREFVRLMGAATALAGLGGAGCRKPEAHLIPYTQNVEWVIPGKALLYATAMPWREGAVPLVVTTYEGRPTKLDGNPLHPNSHGTSDAWTQASILDLYDPDRSRVPLTHGRRIPPEQLAAALGQLKSDLAAAQGAGHGFLVGRCSSPTRRRPVEEMRKAHPQARWFCYEALDPVAARAAAARAYGPGVRLVTDFTKARRVLALDSDFLGVDKESVAALADFAAARKPEDEHGRPRKDMARLYVVEPALTVTGGMADHRLRAAGGKVAVAAALVAGRVAEITRNPGLQALVQTLSLPSGHGFDLRWIDECAADLAAAAGQAVVLAGPRQPVGVHLLAHAVNDALGTTGPEGCVSALASAPEAFGSLADLKESVAMGEVATLVSLTPADPAYDTPGDYDWADLRSRLRKFIHLGPRVNRTAVGADLHVPGTHFLEEWGDVLDPRGVYSVVQPMILPLHGGTSELAFYLRLLAPATPPPDAPKDDPAYLAVRETFAARHAAAAQPGPVDDAWDKTLRDGFLHGPGFPPARAEPTAFGTLAPLVAEAFPPPVGEGMEILFATDPSLYDGRFINNGWLQEMPDPVTKLTWDNAALLSPKTAEALGVFTPAPRKGNDPHSRFQSLGNGDQTVPMVKVTVGDASVTLPVLVAFGHADDAITLPLGYGQSGGADQPQLPMQVGAGTGFDVNPLRRLASPFLSRGKVEKAGGRHTLALTQEHGSMEGRALVREGTVERYGNDPTFAAHEAEDSHIPPNISLYKPAGYDRQSGRFDRPHLFDQKNQWGMVIDLSQCIGCNACLLACQAENNIPIVGKDQVRRGREMHWIRMDRYFVAQQDEHGRYLNQDNPEMLMQPVACVHCESAPCETVCPVNATVHSEDGLNLMAYNRCIGTRYCGNNCPYKARRFNFFDYNKRPLRALYSGPWNVLSPDPEKSRKGVPQGLRLQKNPNVTVRMRGVMEKCTYCLQRLEAAKIKQVEQRRRKPQQDGTPSAATELTLDELRVPGDSVQVACQQACPSQAIVFGNLLDPHSALRRLKHIDEADPRRPIVGGHPRNYDLLRYINTLPRTSYLARIKNPNPRMPDAAFVGNATVSIH